MVLLLLCNWCKFVERHFLLSNKISNVNQSFHPHFVFLFPSIKWSSYWCSSVFGYWWNQVPSQFFLLFQFLCKLVRLTILMDIPSDFLNIVGPKAPSLVEVSLTWNWSLVFCTQSASYCFDKYLAIPFFFLHYFQPFEAAFQNSPFGCTSQQPPFCMLAWNRGSSPSDWGYAFSKHCWPVPSILEQLEKIKRKRK